MTSSAPHQPPSTSSWSTDERRRLTDVTEIGISTDSTARPFTPIWCVIVNHDLYVRSHYGGDGAWYRAVTRAGHGRIRVDGAIQDVIVEPVADEELSDLISDAYVRRYRGSTYLGVMIERPARSATLRVRPDRPASSS